LEKVILGMKESTRGVQVEDEKGQVKERKEEPVLGETM